MSKCYEVEVEAMDGERGYWYFRTREEAEKKVKEIVEICKQFRVCVVCKINEVDCDSFEPSMLLKE